MAYSTQYGGMTYGRRRRLPLYDIFLQRAQYLPQLYAQRQQEEYQEKALAQTAEQTKTIEETAAKQLTEYKQAHEEQLALQKQFGTASMAQSERIFREDLRTREDAAKKLADMQKVGLGTKAFDWAMRAKAAYGAYNWAWPKVKKYMPQAQAAPPTPYSPAAMDTLTSMGAGAVGGLTAARTIPYGMGAGLPETIGLPAFGGYTMASAPAAAGYVGPFSAMTGKLGAAAGTAGLGLSSILGSLGVLAPFGIGSIFRGLFGSDKPPAVPPSIESLTPHAKYYGADIQGMNVPAAQTAVQQARMRYGRERGPAGTGGRYELNQNKYRI